MILTSNEQFLAALFRVGKVAHPTVYPSVDAPAAIVGRRNTYRKGDATVIINTPEPGAEGATLPRGRYQVRSATVEKLPPVKIMDAAGKNPYVTFQKGEFAATGKRELPLQLTRGVPAPRFSVSDVEAFPSAIIRAQAILARDGRLLLFDSKTSKPIHEFQLTCSEPFHLDGIVVLSSFTRAILREAFYSSVHITPTSPETFLSEGIAFQELGMSFRAEGRGGEVHTIIQPGTLVAKSIGTL